MTALTIIACLGILLAVGYFFYCCMVTLSLWLRARLEDQREHHGFRSA